MKEGRRTLSGPARKTVFAKHSIQCGPGLVLKKEKKMIAGEKEDGPTRSGKRGDWKRSAKHRYTRDELAMGRRRWGEKTYVPGENR